MTDGVLRTEVSQPLWPVWFNVWLLSWYCHSGKSMSFLYSKTQNWTQYSRYGLTSAGYKWRTTSLNPLTTLANATQYAVGLLCHKATAEVSSTWRPLHHRGLFLLTCFASSAPSLYLLMHSAISSQMQDVVLNCSTPRGSVHGILCTADCAPARWCLPPALSGITHKFSEMLNRHWYQHNDFGLKALIFKHFLN